MKTQILKMSPPKKKMSHCLLLYLNEGFELLKICLTFGLKDLSFRET